MQSTREQKQKTKSNGKQDNRRSSDTAAYRHQGRDFGNALSDFFEEPCLIGRVCAVDTQSIVVRLRSEDLMSRVMVGNLAAVKSQLNGQCIIGVVTKIMSEGASDPDDAFNSALGAQAQDQRTCSINSAARGTGADSDAFQNSISSAGGISASASAYGSSAPFAYAEEGRSTMVLQLIGTYYALWGQSRHIFRRSLYAVPSLNAECALLYGGNLRCFMSALSAGSRLENDMPLEAGVYTMDGSTRICIDGNKFLQRHALITGSTGSGKSWCVASLLEKAAKCRGTNIVLFDLHGEYKTLKGPAFRHFHIAGPDERSRQRMAFQASALFAGSNLSSSAADSTPLYLPYWFFNYEDLIAWFIGRTDYNAPLVTQVFSREVLKCKQQFAKLSGWPELEAGAENLTSNTPVPYKLEDVIKALKSLDEDPIESKSARGGTKKGPYNGLLTRTINRIKNRREDKRCAFMFLEDSAEENDFGYLLKFCRALLTPAHIAGEGSSSATSHPNGTSAEAAGTGAKNTEAGTDRSEPLDPGCTVSSHFTFGGDTFSAAHLAKSASERSASAADQSTAATAASDASTKLSSEASSLQGAEPSASASASEETSSSGLSSADAAHAASSASAPAASAAPSADAPQGGIKIIDLSEVPAELLPMVVSQIARLIFEVQFWTDSAERFPIALFCDEAHLYIPDERSGASERPAFIFERIAKEGRKYGISLVAISQRPSELNRTIISQCSNFVVMHLTNLKDKEVVQNMMPESMAYLVRQLPILEPGEAVFVGDACLLPSRVKLDVPLHKPDSATVDIWSVWSQGCPRDQAKVIDRSVLSLCRQSRFKL